MSTATPAMWADAVACLRQLVVWLKQSDEAYLQYWGKHLEQDCKSLALIAERKQP